MNNERCINCVGARKLSCDASRIAVQAGLERVGDLGLDHDLHADAILDMTKNVASVMVRDGCGLTIDQIRQQMVQ